MRKKTLNQLKDDLTTIIKAIEVGQSHGYTMYVFMKLRDELIAKITEMETAK